VNDGAVYVWRHPQPIGAEGRCIGRIDLTIDLRKARRLARRIAGFAEREGLPRIVVTSPLRRCAEVGRWLSRCGWAHRIDAALVEVDFGAWEGLRWDSVPRAEIDAWCADFPNYRPGGGEALVDLLARARAWSAGTAQVVVGHAGWIQAMRWLQDRGDALPHAAEWPPGERFGGGPALFRRTGVGAQTLQLDCQPVTLHLSSLM
jgi:alpha-ribazole phosphatase